MTLDLCLACRSVVPAAMTLEVMLTGIAPCDRCGEVSDDRRRVVPQSVEADDANHPVLRLIDGWRNLAKFFEQNSGGRHGVLAGVDRLRWCADQLAMAFGCNNVPLSSRACERGTKCCTVEHGEQT